MRMEGVSSEQMGDVELLAAGEKRSTTPVSLPTGMSRSGSIDTITVSGTSSLFFIGLLLIVLGGAAIGLNGMLTDFPAIIVGAATAGVGLLLFIASFFFPLVQVKFDRGSKIVEKEMIRAGCFRRSLDKAPFYAITGMTQSLVTGSSTISNRGSTTQRKSDFYLDILFKDSHTVHVAFVAQKDLSHRYAEWGCYFQSLAISPMPDI